MPDILLRQMRESDIPSIAEIECASFSTPWSVGAFEQEIHKPYALSRVAVLEERVLGYLCANIVLDECHILDLAVHPNFRRQRIASVLMERVMAESKEKRCRMFYLEVRSSNAAARFFYERLGFMVAGVRRNYYDRPAEDAAVMALRI